MRTLFSLQNCFQVFLLVRQIFGLPSPQHQSGTNNGNVDDDQYYYGEGTYHFARLTCYDGPDCKMRFSWWDSPMCIVAGNNRRTNYNLNELNFYKRIESCTYDDGVWLLHENPNYNSNGGMTVWGWGDGMNLTYGREFAGRAASVRLSGAPEGYRFSTFNSYEGTYFNGREDFTYDSNSNYAAFDYGQASVIITGCEHWGVFSEPDYRGDSLCLSPGPPLSVDREGYPTVCKPRFITDLAKLGGIDFTDRISSVRKGCGASNGR